jgi:hypothetical protein
VLRCIHCGEQSGLLRRQHAACRERHDAAIGQFPGFFVKFMASPMPLDKFRALADEIATGAHIRGEEFKAVRAGGIEAMVVAATAGGELTPEDSAHITTLAEAFGVDLHALPRAGLRLAKASVLRELKEGKLPAGIDVEGPVILNLERDESVVWVFNDVACYSIARGDKAATHSQQVGHASVTMRMNGFKAPPASAPNPVSLPGDAGNKSKKKSARRADAADEASQPLALDGTGDLVLTNRHLSFLSDAIALKIALRHIVALVPHTDGLRVMRDEASGRPQTFVVDDPAFAATAITLLNRP